MSTVYAVPGISCANCLGSITTRVGGLPGVDGVEVDLVAKAVMVHGKPDHDAVRAGIAEADNQVMTTVGPRPGPGHWPTRRKTSAAYWLRSDANPQSTRPVRPDREPAGLHLDATANRDASAWTRVGRLWVAQGSRLRSGTVPVSNRRAGCSPTRRLTCSGSGRTSAVPPPPESGRTQRDRHGSPVVSLPVSGGIAARVLWCWFDWRRGGPLGVARSVLRSWAARERGRPAREASIAL